MVVAGAGLATGQSSAVTNNQFLQDILLEALALYDSEQLDAARSKYELVVCAAGRRGNLAAEAEARRGVGLVQLEKANYAEARDQLERALALFEQLDDPQGLARARQHLGRLMWLTNDKVRSQEFYRQALAGFEAVGDLKGQAYVLLALEAAEGDRDPQLDRAEALANQVGDARLLGMVAHFRADQRFAVGDYAGAMAMLETAIAQLERAGARRALARALTSLGRLNRAHGRADRSIDLYKRALEIQEAIGDQQGVIQTINATAIALEVLGRQREALVQYERALVLARKTGSDRIIQFQLGNLGSAYNGAGQWARGVAMLEDVVRQPIDAPLAAGRYSQLSYGYLRLGRYADTVAAADKSIALYHETGNPDGRKDAQINRARARQKLGLTADALADTREVLELIERVRARLVPSDFMKQGHAETLQDTFAVAVSLYHELGQPELALETAARAQARAFLDLLASRGLDTHRVEPTDGPAGSLSTLPLAPRDRPSPAVTAASSVDELRATARRLRSTLLAYFVTADTTYVWVVPPDGPIGAAQVAVSAARLTDLVRQTRPGETPKPTETETTGATLRLASSSAPPLRTRGPDTFTLAVHRSPAWRTLHRLLIRPVEDQLPGMAGSRLTILPHGPLSLLSFAALEDDRGRYLLERFTLHYAPAAGALRFTEQTQRRLTDTDSRYLLVADPSAMPSNGRRPLRALPASRREVTTIASLLPRDAASVLTGAAAGEADVRARLAGATVVHFATHGIVRSDAPLESFLALGRSDDAAASDGRLTAAEIYDLNLHADVVILSACRTALGTVSGDGVLGLTRAFFYAGAASIVATMWDVADDPTMRLIPDFYRRRLTGTDKAEALRAAQLTLLRDLRAGRVTIGEGASKVALPENPFFWAGFVLTGEP